VNITKNKGTKNKMKTTLPGLQATLLSSLFLLLASTPINAQQNRITTAKSYTGWDCCKPICAGNNNRADILTNRGVARVCDKANKLLDQNTGLRANSGCANSGSSSAYLCDSYQPLPVANDFSYGFAIQVSDNQNADHANCCKCYSEYFFLSSSSFISKR
jgi:hypothetical protein